MLITAILLAVSQAGGVPAWTSDQGDGTYRNPVLAGDWSDPYVVRVGDDYYLTASSFANVPGLPILHSRDLVNWTIVGHALPRNLPHAQLVTPRRGGGVWAPSIRHRAGKFLIYHPDPMTLAISPSAEHGPWASKARETRARVRFAYSLDGRRFTPFGASFVSRYGRWVGAQIGLFAVAPSGTPAFTATTTGHADFADFEVTR